MAWRSSVLVLVVVSLFATTLLVAQGPTLTKATLKTTTKDDDRDRDTAIFVQVTENDAKTELAKVAYAEVGGQYGYADHTTHQFNFPPVKMGIPKSQCQKNASSQRSTRNVLMSMSASPLKLLPVTSYS